MWQIELIDHVTWLEIASRTRPPPEEPGDRALPRPRHQRAEQRGQQQADGRPDPERPRHLDDGAVGEQVRDEPAVVGLVPVEEPAHVGVHETLGHGQRRRAEQPRGVRVAVPVGVGVVAAVVGHPVEHVALDGERAGDRHRDAQPLLRLERLVREVPVEAHRDTENGGHVEEHQQREIVPADPPSPTPAGWSRPARSSERARTGR